MFLLLKLCVYIGVVQFQKRSGFYGPPQYLLCHHADSGISGWY